MAQVFISYSRKDLKFVKRLAEDLNAAGFAVWYDLSGLDGGTTWGSEIQSAIENSQFFLVVLSPNALASKWVQREFLFAENCNLKVIPLQYLPCRLPMWLLDLQLIDLQGKNYAPNFERLLKALGAPVVAVEPLEKDKTVAEKQAREVSREQEKKLKDEELKRRQAEKEALQARQEQQKRDQVEEQLRRQAEKQQHQAENRSRREQAWRIWKPRLPRLAGLGVVGVVLIGAIFLAPGLLRGLPARPQPTASPIIRSTSTYTPESVAPTSTALPTETPTAAPTAIPTASPTVTPTAFYDPVLAYISAQPPTFEDDFSNKQIKPGWGGTTSEGYGLNPDVITEGNTLLIRDYIEPDYAGTAPADFYVPGVSFPMNGLFDTADLAFQFEVKINELKSIGIQFRSTLTLDTSIMQTGYRFTLYTSGDWDLKKNLNESPIAAGHQGIDPRTFNKVLLIAKGDHASIFLNNQLLYQGDGLSTSNTSNRIVAYNNVYQPTGEFWNVAGAEFDDFKFWNLTSVDFQAAPTPTGRS